MQPLISDLVSRYERGGLSRRELIQGLASLVAVAATSGAAAATEPQRSLVPGGIDHVSVRVSDLARSAAFYQSLFGLRPLSEDKPHKILRLGDKRVIVSLRQDTPHGQIDHFGVGVPDFDKAEVTRLLEERGLTPQEDWEYGFYVRDPDGVPVQVVKSG
jgi:catechol 2,3-dioxygenase-like lactoylglutathione lyase family enzyme